MSGKIKTVHIFGGGTVAHVTNHFALCAPAYGKTARLLEELCKVRFPECNVKLHLTKMAGGPTLETNEDILNELKNLKGESSTRVIFMNAALVDFMPTSLEQNNKEITNLGKYSDRLNSIEGDIKLFASPQEKVIRTIRETRKDIFLVGFKTTCGACKQEMFEKGLSLVKKGSVNLVLVNDTKTHWNMIVTPEEAVYHETSDRLEALTQLVDMAWHRSHLAFTQSTVKEGKPVSWSNSLVPASLREIVNYCIENKAYKVFNGATVGHFAVKLSDTQFLTSIRKSNFNDLNTTGLVYVETDGPDTILAYGAKPSVGGQSQRIVFKDHPGMDCIVHFHCPLKPDHRDNITVKSQREVECGSHECGKNTSSGLSKHGNLLAVMLDNHGPNIVFNKSIDPKEVIDFINANFDLSKKTGGYHLK